ncbi:hypothetical protein [Acetobacter sp.]|uniref:hypothetical protein n=1 Tax=Acetobacter sp. TaxID=440 RepID=UPI002584B066|nr:hypothetical protein [Acetobacter sp.]MCC6104636.1 hypothetical protein [Acetobacter sp.]
MPQAHLMCQRLAASGPTRGLAPSLAGRAGGIFASNMHWFFAARRPQHRALGLGLGLGLGS